MAETNLRIVIRINKEFSRIRLASSSLRQLVKSVCKRFAPKRKRGTFFEINITITDDRKMAAINFEFLRRRTSTDVLSFELSDKNEEKRTFELVVNGRKAMREAKKRGHAVAAELSLYIVHGLLHQFGFDDSSRQKAKKMHEMEDRILREHGFDAVYYKSSIE